MIIKPDVIKGILEHNQTQDLNFCPPLPGIDGKSKQPAAVLIPLFLDQETWKLLFIKRTYQKSDHHSGQIAFPGGRADQTDTSLMATALRESTEEIGIDPGDVDILGESCPIATVTNYEITPFVGLIPWPYPLVRSKTEVERIITIPVAWLADPSNRRTESWKSISNPNQRIPVIYFNEFKGDILWGATAQIVVDFLDLVQNL